MLKNKFGMTKILVLVLSVLMLVSLVACNKADGPSTDDMNAAIQAAIDAANAEQAAKEAALAASIAADKAAQEAKDAALAESIAKEKAENDAALKKAQEEAKAAADAAAAASKAAKEAADKAAKDAADAAAKAAKEAADKAAKEASEAAKKAQEAADKQASELAAALEAAKAEALKAQEEASKAAAEASKAIEEASKAAEEAAKASSQLAETTVPAETTDVVPVETTVVAPAETTVAPETTTIVAPGDVVDTKAALARYAELKVKYTITDKAKYLPAEYAEIVLLFDKAATDIMNAVTDEAATSVLFTLENDVLTITSVETVAAEVADLIDALKDIESQVFTTQATMIDAARDAYDDLLDTYEDYFGQDQFDTADKLAKEIKRLGINAADLDLAERKLVVLTAYIESQLHNNMWTIYNEFEGKFSRFDAEDYAEDTVLNKAIHEAHYNYLVLATVNGGDVAAADLVTKYAEKLDENGKKTGKPDTTKPIEIFTVEELVNTFILPTLDYEFEDYILEYILKPAKTTLVTNGSAFKPVELKAAYAAELKYTDYDDALDAIYEKLEAELEALTYSADYKGNVTLKAAKADVVKTAVKAYLDALNVYLDAAKAVAIEVEEELTTLAIEGYEKKIEELEEELTKEGAHVELLNSQIALWSNNINTAEANLDSFIANIKAATLPTYDELLSSSIKKNDDYKVGNKNVYVELNKIIDKSIAAADVVKYLNQAIKVTVDNNFVEKIAVEGADASETELLNLMAYVVSELETLRVRVDPIALTEESNDIYLTLRGDEKSTGYAEVVKYYENDAAFPEIVTLIKDAIAEVKAVSADQFAPKNEKLPSANDKAKFYFYKDADAKAYIDSLNLDLAEIIELHEDGEDKGAITTAKTGDYPIYYVITPAEQAAEKVATIYYNTFVEVNKKLVALNDVIAEQKLLITNADAKTAYDNILGKTSGDLQAEIKAVGEAYIKEIETVAYKFDYNFEDDSQLTVAKLYAKAETKKADLADMITITKDFTTSYAKAYNPKGFEAKLLTVIDEDTGKVVNTGVVDTFKANFYEDGVVSENLTDVQPAMLYSDKLAAVTRITNKINEYKNQYEEKDGVISIKTPTAKYTYTLADDVAAYEKALDDLLVSYTAKIMAVKQGSGKLVISDGMGTALKYNGKNWDGKSGCAQVTYDIATAEAAIAAYETALFGDVTVTLQDGSNKTYSNGNSEIFKQYNNIVLKNVFGYAK